MLTIEVLKQEIASCFCPGEDLSFKVEPTKLSEYKFLKDVLIYLETNPSEAYLEATLNNNKASHYQKEIAHYILKHKKID